MANAISVLLSSIISAILVMIFLMVLHAFYGLEAENNLIEHCVDLGYVGGEIGECVEILKKGEK